MSNGPSTRRKSRAVLENVYDVDAPDVECPVCDAWVGWACGDYHAAGYHRKRIELARREHAASHNIPTRAA